MTAALPPATVMRETMTRSSSPCSTAGAYCARYTVNSAALRSCTLPRSITCGVVVGRRDACALPPPHIWRATLRRGRAALPAHLRVPVGAADVEQRPQLLRAACGARLEAGDRGALVHILHNLPGQARARVTMSPAIGCVQRLTAHLPCNACGRPQRWHGHEGGGQAQQAPPRPAARARAATRRRPRPWTAGRGTPRCGAL